MKLHAYCILGLAAKKRQVPKGYKPTFAQCQAHGVDVEGKNIKDLDCSNGKCTIICEDGHANMGQKKVKCKYDKKSKYRL